MAAFILRMIKCLVVITLVYSMSGCLILMFAGPTSFEAAQSNNRKKENQPRCPKARVYTMRGFLDVFSTGMYSLADRIHNDLDMQATPVSYLEEKRLSKFLIKEYQTGKCRSPIILIGHSYGADDQITVAKRLKEAHVPVELLITLDHTKKQTIPSNVRTFYNINSGKSIFYGLIPWGCPLDAVHKQTRMVTVDLIKDKGFRKVNHFNIDKLPVVQKYIVGIIRDQEQHRAP